MNGVKIAMEIIPWRLIMVELWNQPQPANSVLFGVAVGSPALPQIAVQPLVVTPF